MSDTWRGGPFRALAHTFTIAASPAATFEPRLARQFQPLADSGAAAVHHYEVTDTGRASGDRYVVSVDGQQQTAVPSRYAAATSVQWLVNRAAVTEAPVTVVQLHAGAVQIDGRTLVLPAPMDSGKTTTVAALVQAGAAFVTDEIVELDPDLVLRRAYRKPLSLDRSAVRLLGISAIPFPGAEREPQLLVPPDWLGLDPEPRLPSTVDAIVVPSYRPGSSARLEPLTPAELALALMESTFRFPERSAQAMPLLTTLAEQAPAARLVLDDVAEAVTAVRGFARGLPVT